MLPTLGPLIVDLGDPDFYQDPYPVWAKAREAGRTARTARGEPVVLLAEDLDTLHTDPAFSQPGLLALDRLGVTDGPFRAWRSLTMAAHDGAVHRRLRGTLGRAFTPPRVEPMRARLRSHAAEVLEETTATGELDVVGDYADDLPLWLVCEFLGLPQGARREIGEFLAGTEEGFTDPLTAEGRQRAEEGIVALGVYVERLVAQRRGDPGEDLVSDLVAAENAGTLAHEELVALVVNVIGGAVGSSRAAIADAVLLMLEHPDQAAWVRSTPVRVRPAVEECLRYRPPFRLGRKLVVAETEHFGLRLAPGDTVVVARQSANRDPARFEDPDRFDASRPERRHHSFGYGPHFCLGNALARLDVQEALSVFLEHFPAARLADGPPRRVPFTIDEQLESLRVRVGPRSATVR